MSLRVCVCQDGVISQSSGFEDENIQILDRFLSERSKCSDCDLVVLPGKQNFEL